MLPFFSTQVYSKSLNFPCSLKHLIEILTSESFQPNRLKRIIEHPDESQFRNYIDENGVQIGQIRSHRVGNKISYFLDDQKINKLDTIGAEHEIIFTYQKHKKQRIIKILPSHFKVRRIARMILIGKKYSHKMGGPKLHRFGTIKFKDDEYFYLDMELLFPDQKTVTLDNLYFFPERTPEWLTTLLSKDKEKEKVIENIQTLIIQALKLRVQPKDPDIILSETGQVRWIDYGLWEVNPPVSEIAKSIGDLLNMLNTNKVHLGEQLKIKLKKMIKTNKNKITSSMTQRELEDLLDKIQ